MQLLMHSYNAEISRNSWHRYIVRSKEEIQNI